MKDIIFAFLLISYSYGLPIADETVDKNPEQKIEDIKPLEVVTDMSETTVAPENTEDLKPEPSLWFSSYKSFNIAPPRLVLRPRLYAYYADDTPHYAYWNSWISI